MQLILLRHAKAVAATASTDDAQRALTPAGHGQAQVAADWLRGQGIVPQRLLVSPALRTRQTAEPVIATLGIADTDVIFLPELYPTDTAVGTVLNHPCGDCRTLMVIGHNPAMEQLAAALLATGETPPASIKPATLVLLQALDATATAVTPASFRLQHVQRCPA